ncbi:MAG: MerR family transcriptional regulator [Lacrimispora sp.]|uniref:MerR family transcriptional regulator n=1 Tax=Lacrimispora sp. TaxID=2719234 RepID=UPI0039E3FE32
MRYTITQAAERCNVKPHTLRFYEKEGLLPFVERTPGGIRSFKESDLAWLEIVNCLKETGLPIKEIKEFIDLFMQGDATLKQRQALIKRHRDDVKKQIKALRNNLKIIEDKVLYYEEAVNAGTESIHEAKYPFIKETY